MPELREPPNGAARSRTKKQLTHTVPATSAALTRSARPGSPVYTIAARPYRVSLASAIGFVLVGERLQGEHRAEDLLRQDLRPGRRVGEQRGPVVQAAELVVGAAAEDRTGTVGLGALDEPVDALEVLAGDLRADVGGRLLAGRPARSRPRPRVNRSRNSSWIEASTMQPRARQADLTRVVELVDRLLHDRIEIGVGEGDERRLAPELEASRA